jgi:stalled ribosome rescue protein Dom34
VKHAVIWIDQKEARIIEVEADKAGESVVDSPGPHIHRHANEIDLRIRNHPDDEHRYFREVARALHDHGQILLVGPAQTKLHFFRYLHEHDRPLEAKVAGIESADHPTDAQLVAHLRSYFHEPAPRRGL